MRSAQDMDGAGREFAYFAFEGQRGTLRWKHEVSSGGGGVRRGVGDIGRGGMPQWHTRGVSPERLHFQWAA